MININGMSFKEQNIQITNNKIYIEGKVSTVNSNINEKWKN